MNRSGRSVVWMAIVVAIVWGINGIAYAQYARPKADADKSAKSTDSTDVNSSSDKVVKIRKLTGLGKDSLVKTPEFRATGANGVKEPQEWDDVTVTFDSAQDWIDTLTLRYYVMALKGEGAKKQYSFYQLVVRYHDVEKGKAHKASAHLLPMALKRFGPIVAVGVEALVDEKVVDTEEEKIKSVGLPEQWWTKSAVIEKDSVKNRDGYLKARADTPFALVDFDDYEVGE